MLSSKRENSPWPGPHFEDRIAELRGLRKGWYIDSDDPSAPPSGDPIREGIFTLMYTFLRELSHDVSIPNPAVCATEEGYLQLIWPDICCEIQSERISTFMRNQNSMDCRVYPYAEDGMNRCITDLRDKLQLRPQLQL